MSRPSEDDGALGHIAYLRDLADRIFQIPVMYGVDQGDYDRLLEIASDLERMKALWVQLHAKDNET